MHVRTRDRLKALEARILPKGRAFVFVFFSGEGSSRADQLAAFKAESGADPSDTIHEVILTFPDPSRVRKLRSHN
jgi:hypothetical protein